MVVKKQIVFTLAFLVMIAQAFSLIAHTITPPQVTVVFVIDQFAYNYLYKLKSYLTGGIKYLLDNGITYENAHHPHAMPETCVGHAAIGTGTLPKEHGIIANSWFDSTTGKTIECADNDPNTAAVFGPNDTMRSHGKGPGLIMVDGLSDQFALSSEPDSLHEVFSISIKDRAAIAMANKSGKAIWFDKETGMFTSSKAYFKELPHWIQKFNNQKKITELKEVRWNLVFSKKSKAYDYYQIKNYGCIAGKGGMAGTTMPIVHDAADKEPFAPVYLSPLGNKLVLELAQRCIQRYVKPHTQLLLWISLSDLDLVGHQYGPDSLEAIDMIYHIDKQIKQFIAYVEKKIGKEKVLFALTGDHGIVPMQCILHEEGINTAHKLNPKDIMTEMNTLIKQKHGVENLVTNFQMPQFYFDAKIMSEINHETQQAINRDVKSLLFKLPAVKNVWTSSELDTLSFDRISQEMELNFKNQRYPGRSGQIFVQLQPYSLLTKYEHGTTHESPYNYDTHVPLILYKKGEIEHKKITKKVYITQLANTLAQILDVPQPSASTFEILPGIFDMRSNKPQAKDEIEVHQAVIAEDALTKSAISNVAK